ncbi:hypothetical protein CRYUN_Cryun09bG0051600 [Craigia yunnanensis]
MSAASRSFHSKQTLPFFSPPALSLSSNPWLSRNSFGTHVSCKRMANFDYLLMNLGNLRKKCLISPTSSDNHMLVGYRKHFSAFRKSRRMGLHFPLASAEDGVTVSGSPQTSTSTDVDEIRVKLNQSLQGEDYSNGLVQSLHDAARVFELAIIEQGSLSKLSWFSTAWLGVDRNAWVKTLSYQAAVHPFRKLQARFHPENKMAKGNHVVLRNVKWIMLGDLRFTAATDLCGKGKSLGTGSASDKALLMLALTCVAAISKLGPAKISCSPFYSMIPDITGRLMDMLVDFIPIHQAYHSIKDISLCKEFLVHFGSRAAACSVENDQDSEEIFFWVDLVQKQLQQAIDKEKIWSRLTTSESIEVLERDLTIFGFFIALGRNTQAFLSANGFDVIDDPIESFIRYLIGGSLLYYPQLSSISSYQQYVESFIKYSRWLENPFNVKSARRNKLMVCMEELGIPSREMVETGSVGRTGLVTEKDSDSFDKSVEEVLKRLENLLQELHVSRSYSGKEQLHAACSDLEKIGKLKKEAEFLEPSFREKEAFLRQGNEFIEQNTSNIGIADSEPNESRRFEQLRNELIELEKHVKRSADQSAYEEDVLQGTQFLAIDVASAMELLRRALIGDELAEKEKKALRRTPTDLASVVPIGVLMLLPVTAVGHAAVLAAIQRYVPALIPSTYGPERLDLLRQLEKVKEMETSEVDFEENVEEVA